jgi:energy-coupling factor transport system permease protein
MSQIFRSFVFKTRAKSIFSKLNSATNLLFYFLASFSALITSNLLLGIFLLASSVAVVSIARVPLSFARLFVSLAAWFALVLGLIISFLGTNGGHVVYFFAAPGFDLKVTYGNLIVASSLFIKILSLGLFTCFYVYVSEPKTIVSALRSLKAPYQASLSIALVFRSLAIFATDYTIITEAQKSRGLDVSKGNLLKRIKKLVNIVIPLVFLSLKRADDLTNALETRGYDASKKRTEYYNFPFKTLDYLIIGISLLLLAVTVLVSFVGV